MREHKYRAWHKKEKRMIEPVIQIHLGYMPYIGWYETEHDALEGNLTTAFLDEVELMDGTGLKDKNGKQIYEGDILDVDGTPWLVEPIGTEERDGGKFGLCASPYGSGEAYFIDKSILDGKVIGNIYEHPHLLKGDGCDA